MRTAVAIARRLPPQEQSEWFPIYWGWWLTGSDFLVMHERAMEVQTMLSGVEDREIRLQMKHCLWAIDFNLGRHRETQEAIARGLALYDERSAETSQDTLRRTRRQGLRPRTIGAFAVADGRSR